jgi:DNA mismatch repair protein MutL
MDEEENQKTSKIQSVKETKLNEQSQLSNQLNNTSQKKNDITEDYQSSPKPDEKRIFDQTSQKSLLDDGRLEVKPLAQLNQSYILAQGPEGLYLIDQHAAHERIIFNRLNKILHQTGVPTQYILLPETIEFSSHQALAANHLSLALNKIGFDLEPFGETTFVLKGIPSILKPSLGREALLEILSAAQEHLKSFEGSGLNKIIDDMSGSWLYSLACRAAIKAGQKLTIEEMENLIKDLYNAESGGYCPHGRPSVIVLSYHDLEKKFGRI